ncbi:MAG: hypothetical protein AAF614_35660, partial [Chloroflexota bacterium]
MPEFQDLLHTFEQLTKQSARFRRVVLHTHSPDSYDFGRNGDPGANSKKTLLQVGNEHTFIQPLQERYDLVAITDHMKVGYACRLANAVDEDSDFCILPGVELTVRLAPPLHTLKLHILAIFPHTKTVGEIERIFPSNIPADTARTGKEQIELSNANGLRELADLIREHDGICIAAHVNSTNGIRKLFQQTGKKTLRWFNKENTKKASSEDNVEISTSFRDYLVSAQFEGIEVSKAEDRKHYTWETEIDSDLKHRVPVFLTFDAHSIEELAEKADRATYVKMTNVSLEGLKSAIKFPDTRIRFSMDREPLPYICGIEIVGPKQDGFFKELQIGLVENLNCVIGPRGSGKSTIIDALRYVFGYNHTLDELDSKDLKNAVLARQRKNLQNSIIRIAYRLPSDAKTHVLEATYDPNSDYVTKVFDSEGNPLHVANVERSGRYPLRLFGWSEIETLGRDPARQLDLLDKLVAGLPDLQEKQKKLRSHLASNTSSIQGVVKELGEIFARNNNKIRRYQEFEQEFRNLNTAEVQQLFSELDTNRERYSLLEKFEQAISEIDKQIQNIRPKEIENEFKEAVQPDSDLGKWWQDLDETNLLIVPTRQAIEAKVAEIAELLQSLREKGVAQSSLLFEKIEEGEKTIRQMVSSDSSKKVLADLRTQAKERLEQVEVLREEYHEKYQALSDLLKTRRQYICDLKTIHQKVAQLREAKKDEIEAQLNEFQTPEMTILLDFKVDGDRSLFEEALRKNKCPQLREVRHTYRASGWPEILSAKCTPVEFTKCIWDKTPSVLEGSMEVNGKSCSINNEQAEQIVEVL